MAFFYFSFQILSQFQQDQVLSLDQCKIPFITYLLFFFGAIVALAASAGRVKSSRSRHAAVRRPATARVVALPSAGHRVRVEFSRRCLCTLYALIGFEYEEMDDGADESWSRSLFHQTVISYLHSGLW